MVDKKSIRVAAIQLISINGSISQNLVHAESFIIEAKNKGAEVILLPELMPTGYDLNWSIWESAESSDGTTVQWLAEQCLKHSIWMGTSYLEASGSNFYNTFVLVNPDGEIAIEVRKSRPSATEAFLFLGCPGRRVVETPIGKIGVSICYEGFLSSTINALFNEEADLVLMPMSAPTPTLNPPLRKCDIEEYNESIKNLSTNLANELGVPTVMANKVGPWNSKQPWPFPDEDSYFPGFTTITDASGNVISQLGNDEGVIVEDIFLNPEVKKNVLPSSHGKWARKIPKLFNLFIIAETIGGLAYFSSIKRRQKAREISEQAIA